MNEQKSEVTTINIQVGDIISSKKGFINESALTGKLKKCFKMKYEGDDIWQFLGKIIELEEKKEDLK